MRVTLAVGPAGSDEAPAMWHTIPFTFLDRGMSRDVYSADLSEELGLGPCVLKLSLPKYEPATKAENRLARDPRLCGLLTNTYFYGTLCCTGQTYEKVGTTHYERLMATLQEKAPMDCARLAGSLADGDAYLRLPTMLAHVGRLWRRILALLLELVRREVKFDDVGPRNLAAPCQRIRDLEEAEDADAHVRILDWEALEPESAPLFKLFKKAVMSMVSETTNALPLGHAARQALSPIGAAIQTWINVWAFYDITPAGLHRAASTRKTQLLNEFQRLFDEAVEKHTTTGPDEQTGQGPCPGERRPPPPPAPERRSPNKQPPSGSRPPLETEAPAEEGSKGSKGRTAAAAAESGPPAAAAGSSRVRPATQPAAETAAEPQIADLVLVHQGQFRGAGRFGDAAAAPARRPLDSWIADREGAAKGFVHTHQRKKGRKAASKVLRPQWVVDIATLFLAAFHQTMLPYLAKLVRDANDAKRFPLKKSMTSAGQNKFIQNGTTFALQLLDEAFSQPVEESLTSKEGFTPVLADQMGPGVLERLMAVAVGRFRWVVAGDLDPLERAAALHSAGSLVAYGAALFAVAPETPLRELWADMKDDSEEAEGEQDVSEGDVCWD